MNYKKLFLMVIGLMMVGFTLSSAFAGSQAQSIVNPTMGKNLTMDSSKPVAPSNAISFNEDGVPINGQAMPQGMAGGMVTAPSPASSQVDGASISAPTVETVAPELLVLKKVEEELRGRFKKNIFASVNIQSLFFKSDQLSMLNNAREGMSNNILNDNLENDTNTGTVVSLTKEIILGGIVFNTKDNWTIWLNGARTTKTTLPKEVLDINVSAEYVELKWFDEETNQIFPVRLRPNQKFDITQKVFLPAG
jgi:hypothetical protein